MNYDEQLRAMHRKQNEIADSLVTMLTEHGVALLKVGQRSGKTRIQELVVDKFEALTIFLFSPTASVLDFQRRSVSANVLPRKGSVPDNALVILSEPWYLSDDDSYSIHEQARTLGLPVLAVGSNGPRYASEPRWALLPGLSYNTWDVNPSIPRDGQVMKNLYASNPIRAARDYEAF